MTQLSYEINGNLEKSLRFIKQHQKQILNVFFAVSMVILVIYSLQDSAFAQDMGIDIKGTDKSDKLSAFGDIVKTVQTFAIKYVAPLLGSMLALFGIFKIATRDAVVGSIATVGGGALLFLPKIIEQLAKMQT